MKITKIELVVTMNEFQDIKRIAAEMHEAIGIRQWYENHGKFEYLIVVSTNLFATFVLIGLKKTGGRKK